MLPAKAVCLKPIFASRASKSTVSQNGVSGVFDLRRRKQQEDRGNYLVTNPAVCSIAIAIK